MASQSHQDWQLTKKTVLERNIYMFNNPLMSDIKFTCGESKRKYLYAHKYVLATSSPVFFAMFYGDLAEQNSVIDLKDTDEESFEEFLRFLYTDECTLTTDTAVRVLYLAKKYMVHALVDKSVEILSDSINPDSVISILQQAVQFNENNLESKCWQIIDLHAQISLESTSFLDLDKTTLGELLKRDTLKIGEVQLFHSVLKWSDHQCVVSERDVNLKNRRSFLGDVVYQLRFLLMSKSELTSVVLPSGLLTEEEAASVLRKVEGIEPEEPLKWNIEKQRSYFIRATCVSVSVKSTRPNWTHEFVSWISRKVDDEGGDNWRFRMWNTSYLRFKVCVPVMLHGLRLLGDPDDGEYEVAVEIEGLASCVSGKYTSSVDELSGCYGFDVMLETPVAVRPRDFIGVSVSIREPPSHYVSSKLENFVVGGVRVDFEHQYTKRGDIAEIILRQVGP